MPIRRVLPGCILFGAPRCDLHVASCLLQVSREAGGPRSLLRSVRVTSSHPPNRSVRRTLLACVVDGRTRPSQCSRRSSTAASPRGSAGQDQPSTARLRQPRRHAEFRWHTKVSSRPIGTFGAAVRRLDGAAPQVYGTPESRSPKKIHTRYFCTSVLA